VERLILVLIFLLVFPGCAGVSKSSFPKKLPETSPTRVVEGFLEALKKDDFEQAYGFVFTPFSDREGYILRMKNLVENYRSSIVGYRILATQILGDSAIVVAELQVKLKPMGSNGEIHKTTRNQYDLSVVENKWRITSDKCIFNCITREDFAGHPLFKPK
jgi:hypothetical protein